MARKVDPRILRRQTPPPLDDAHDPIAPTSTEVPPFGQVADFRPARAPAAPTDLRSPLEKQADRLRSWGVFCLIMGVVGATVAIFVGATIMANGDSGYGAGVIAGGIAGGGWWIWLRIWHDAAADALDTADFFWKMMERQTALLGQLAQHPTEQDNDRPAP